MKKGVGSGDPDPFVRGTDPHQNVTDPQHCFLAWMFSSTIPKGTTKNTYQLHDVTKCYKSHLLIITCIPVIQYCIGCKS
jgi:hypothetical protein